MSDNVKVTQGSGTTMATNDIGGVHYPRSKVVIGIPGTATDVSAANPMPVTQADAVKAVKNPAIFNAMTSSSPGTETSLDLGTIKRFRVQNRGNVRLQVSYASGQSGTEFYTVPPGSVYEEKEIDDQDVTLYFQAPAASQRLEFVTWN